MAWTSTEKIEMAANENLTDRQKKWFASVSASLPEKTGKTMAEWVAIARTCPHDKPGARRTWMKTEHGVGTNYAAFILSEAFPHAGGWDDAAALRDKLWADTASRTVLEAVEELAAKVDGLVSGQRKSFTAFSRDVQFAAMRPQKTGGAFLGLKLGPAVSPRLTAPKRTESWSERLTAAVELPDAASVDAEVARLFAEAAKNGQIPIRRP